MLYATEYGPFQSLTPFHIGFRHWFSWRFNKAARASEDFGYLRSTRTCAYPNQVSTWFHNQDHSCDLH